MAQLNFFCVVYTDGESPRPLSDPELRWHELPSVPLPGQGDELFGPWAGEASRTLKRMRRAFLFQARRDRPRSAEQFFAHVNEKLTSSVKGLQGYALDVLRLWPLPLREIEELPSDPLPEDLFAVGFEDVTAGGIRAQSFGLSKLGQREIRFTFTDRSLMDEAALLVAHLADYTMHGSRRVEHGQTMSFGFDRLQFLASEGPNAGGPLRSWHAPMVQALLPPDDFEGVGMLDVRAYRPLSEETTPDVTDVLKRSLMQRLLLEEMGVAGDAPSQVSLLRTCGCAELTTAWKAVRIEPNASKDSGWTVTCVKAHEQKDLHDRTVGDLTRKVSSLLRYLALPPGCTVVWQGPTDVKIDCGDLPMDDEPEEGP